MTFSVPALLRADSYKLAHRQMYPDGIEYLQSNFTPRSSRLDGVTRVLFFGFQGWLHDWTEQWNETFFELPLDVVIDEHIHYVSNLLGSYELGVQHITDLHNLGYLPLEFRALPEGDLIPLRVPVFIVENTDRRFAWLVNYIESDLSCGIWLPCTSATIAYTFREVLDKWALRTVGNTEFVDWQGHDFSMRGMENALAAAASSAGHLLNFAGTDSLPSLAWTNYFYGAEGFTGGSVPASEHSVMCAGGELTELETFRRLINLHPTGIVSIVADTWDLWEVLTEHLVTLKDEIMARDGKVVIRPDSGDPADILCGTQAVAGMGVTPAQKGVVELLWDIFGGTFTEKGFKVLDSHIGVIYGDSITKDRAENICSRFAAKGFASINAVFGIGSFTYQYNTRDTLGFAMKATWAQVNGEGHDLFKDPVTDNGIKKSARGRLAVHKIDGEYVLINSATREDEEKSELQPVWRNGEFLKKYTFREIAERVGKRNLMPS